MATKKELIVENWNLKHPVGTKVRFWTFLREGEGKHGVTWTAASMLGDHTPCVYIRDCSGKNVGAVALTHVKAESAGA